MLLLCIQPTPARAQSDSALSRRIQKVISRPEFAHANFGIEFYSLDTGKVVYALNADKLFVPASTTKILTEGTLLAKLGADYRFHTRVYRTGSIDKHGTLKGALILVASGDPNLSNRIQPDGTLAFVDHDHSYNGPALPGDPLAVIKQLARDVVAKGIRKIEGDVYVDATLLPDAGREGGTNVVMSAIMINDNVIDLIAKPGAKPGDPVQLSVSPQTGRIQFVNHLTTSAPDSNLRLGTSDPVTMLNSILSITLEGTIPAGSEPQTIAYPVPSPTMFARLVFNEALLAAGISGKFQKNLSTPPITDFVHYQRCYTPENQVAEHVSPPLSEEIKVTLKVSQNLHAGMGPYLLGLLVARDTKDPLHAGFSVENAFLADAKLDLSGAAQGDGAGGDWADLFSPDFMVHYLTYWTTRPDYQIFFNALPILGKDGTLEKIQTSSPGAGHVFAKTGTFGSEDKLNGKMMLNGKGLVGYVLTKDGKKLAFAAYVNHVSLAPDADAAQQVAGQALGEIAAAAYDANLDASASAGDYDLSSDFSIVNGQVEYDPGKLTGSTAGRILRGRGL